MEVDGKEFMRNVGIEQERDHLIKEQQKLESLKRDAIKRDQDYMANNTIDETDSAYVDLSIPTNTPPVDDNINIIEDIMLEPEDPNKTKKKYIILGIGLILLFVITILVIRLLSNSDTQAKIENINPEVKELNRDKILDKIDTNEKYQKVIDEKKYEKETPKVETPEIIIPEEATDDTPLVIDTPKPKVEPKRDLFGLDKTQNENNEAVETNSKVTAPVEVKKVVKPIEIKAKKPVVKKFTKTVTKKATIKKHKIKQIKGMKRKIVVSPPTETNFTKTTKGVSRYYIQIGAFTKRPSFKLLDNISKKGYSYTVHKMTIKGRIYNKVLIGSYPSRAKAKRYLGQIRSDFNNKNAYILKF